jgi:mono/diheme cytochrome c family protein
MEIDCVEITHFVADPAWHLQCSLGLRAVLLRALPWRQKMTRIWPFLLIAGCVLAADPKPPAQATRGQAFFLDESNAKRCGSCHSLAKQGTAVGPDLSKLASLSPRAILMAVRATRTAYVQVVRLKNGTEFPGMPVAQDDTSAQYYDLSVTPPVLRKLDRKEIASVGDNGIWRHPPESAGYTAQQLADVIAYIKWASYGYTKGVSLDEVQ